MPVLQVAGPSLQFEPVVMYRAAAVRRPVLNGYSGYFPPQHQILVQALAMGDLSVLNGPSAAGPLEILLDRRDDRGRHLGRRLARTRAVLQASDARWSLYSLPQLSATNPATSLASGRAIEIRPVAARASINDDLADAVADGRVDTRWYTDVQRPGHTLTLDLGRPVRVGAVRLVQGDRALDTRGSSPSSDRSTGSRGSACGRGRRRPSRGGPRSKRRSGCRSRCRSTAARLAICALG